MPWFRCFVSGENFPGELIGEAGLVGFYLTRFVQAADAADAEAVALNELKADPRLAPPPGYIPTGQARVFFEEIEEVTVERVPNIQAGITWYSMDE